MTLPICAAGIPSVGGITSITSSSACETVRGPPDHSPPLPADGRDSLGPTVVTSRPACDRELVLPVLVDASALLADVTEWLWAHVEASEGTGYDGRGEGDRERGEGDEAAEVWLVAEGMDAERQELQGTVLDLLASTFAVLQCELQCPFRRILSHVHLHSSVHRPLHFFHFPTLSCFAACAVEVGLTPALSPCHVMASFMDHA